MWRNDIWQIEEMCLVRERSLSNMTPRLRADCVGFKIFPANDIDWVGNLDLCWRFPINKNSVLEGLTERRFEMNQEWTESSVVERRER